MKAFRKIFLFLFLNTLILSIGSCHKYAEDESISLRRPAYRMMGKYNLEHYYVNGTDSVTSPRYAYYADNYHIEVPQVKFALYPPSVGFKCEVDMKTYVAINNFYAGFRNKETALYISIGIQPLAVNLFVNRGNYWNILKLTKHQLHIQATISGNSYEIHLKK